MSEQPATLAAALVQLQARLPRIVKDTPGQYGKYANLASIHELVMPMLAALGMCWQCKPTLRDDGLFVLRYVLEHAETGEAIIGDYPLGQGTAQQLGSAITYARRYTLCAVLGLVADDDDDGTAATQQWHPPANPRTRKADRHRADRDGPLPDDDWTGSAPDETPGSITDGRKKELGYWFTKAGITSSKDRLSYAQARLDRPDLTDSDGLSEADGIKLAALLKEEGR